MKRPYYNQKEREVIRFKTTAGDRMLIHLEILKLRREINREFVKTWLYKIIKKLIYKILEIWNKKKK